MLDALVVGSGPSGLGASLALSGYLPHYVPACTVAESRLEARLRDHLVMTPSGLLTAAEVKAFSSELRGRSNNPLALFFDALHRPGVDLGFQSPSCLELRQNASAGLSHLVVDPAPPGGSWHGMHEATKTLSPGPWMELPGYSLAHFLQQGRSTPPLDAATANSAAQALQPRSTIAEYYRTAAEQLGVAQYYRPWQVKSVQRIAPDDVWTVTFAGATSTPLQARALVLATGTYGMPKRLSIPGEDLGLVAHRCKDLVLPGGSGASVLVVGAGLSATDCIVHLLRDHGANVKHVFRGEPTSTKVGSKFADPGARDRYPEYHALVSAMMAGRSLTPILGGSYTPLAFSELRHVHANGRCEVNRKGTSLALEDVGAVAVLVGSAPDLSFLPPDVSDALAAAGPPPQEFDGVKATHPVFLDTDPFSMEVKAVPQLYALGPLRGDNFARFAVHDGHGVAEALRARKEHEQAGRRTDDEGCIESLP